MVYAPDSWRSNPLGYVYEHFVVVERAMGKRLRKGAEVHHVNGDRADNRNKNLVVCHDRPYHRLLHRRARLLAATGTANYGKWLDSLLEKQEAQLRRLGLD